MSKGHYDKIIAKAVADLNRLHGARATLDQKIAATKRLLVSARELSGRPVDLGANVGLKDACLQVLQGATAPLTLAQVGQELEKIGFSLASYTSSRSAIRNTLKRMVEHEITLVEIGGKKMYRIKTDKDWMNF